MSLQFAGSVDLVLVVCRQPLCQEVVLEMPQVDVQVLQLVLEWRQVEVHQVAEVVGHVAVELDADGLEASQVAVID